MRDFIEEYLQYKRREKDYVGWNDGDEQGRKKIKESKAGKPEYSEEKSGETEEGNSL